MKRFKLKAMALSLLLASAGCSDELPDKAGGDAAGKLHEVEITFNVGINAGLNLSGRSTNMPFANITKSNTSAKPRELTTWEPAQQVNDMRIYVFRCSEKEGKDGDYTFYVPADLTGKDYYDISEKGYFTNQSPYYSKDHEGKFETHTFSIKPMLEEGYYYKFLAVGRDDKYAEECDPDGDVEYQWGWKWLKEPSFTEGTTKFSDANIESGVVLPVGDEDEEPFWSTEIFSGILRVGDSETGEEDAILVSGSTKVFQREITLKRAVAGLMFYVKNIPSEVVDNSGGKLDGKTFTPEYVSLSSSVTSKATGLVNRTMPGMADFVNSTVQDMSLAYIELKYDETWMEDETKKIFTRPANEEKGWPENSYMVSNFVMPTSQECIEEVFKEEGNSPDYLTTFYLQYGAQNKKEQYNRYVKIKIGAPDGSSSNLRPIEANHLYSLGRKDNTHNEPYDLSSTKDGNAEIVIRVDPFWNEYYGGNIGDSKPGIDLDPDWGEHPGGELK